MIESYYCYVYSPHYLNTPDVFGASPLMAACCRGRKKLVYWMGKGGGGGSLS